MKLIGVGQARPGQRRWERQISPCLTGGAHNPGMPTSHKPLSLTEWTGHRGPLRGETPGEGSLAGAAVGAEGLAMELGHGLGQGL